MTEQLHQRLHRAAGVHQRGRVGVAQLVRGDVRQPGACGGAGEFVPERLRGDALAVAGQQEVGEPAGLGVRQRLARAALLDDPVDDLKRLLVQRHHPLLIEL
jgi:hypothetical protein